MLTSIHLLVGKGWRPGQSVQRQITEAHGGGETERNGEPNQASCQEAPNPFLGFGRNTALPVGLIDEHCAKVACGTGREKVHSIDTGSYLTRSWGVELPEHKLMSTCCPTTLPPHQFVSKTSINEKTSQCNFYHQKERFYCSHSPPNWEKTIHIILCYKEISFKSYDNLHLGNIPHNLRKIEFSDVPFPASLICRMIKEQAGRMQ